MVCPMENDYRLVTTTITRVCEFSFYHVIKNQNKYIQQEAGYGRHVFVIKFRKQIQRCTLLSTANLLDSKILEV